jgi:hypothetical protein
MSDKLQAYFPKYIVDTPMTKCCGSATAPAVGAPELAEIEVTPAMIEAGVHVLYESGAIENPILENDQTLVRRVFESMSVAQSQSFR